MSADKITIGLTPENKRIVLRLTEGSWFETQIDAAKFAMAFAIARGTSPGIADRTETVWNTGSFDDDGTLRSIIPALFPGTGAPYKLIEYFINVGLPMLNRELSSDSIGVLQLIDFAAAPER